MRDNDELRKLLTDIGPHRLSGDEAAHVAKQWARCENQLAKEQAQRKEAQRRTRLLERENTDAFRLLIPCLTLIANARKYARANDPGAHWLKQAGALLQRGKRLMKRSVKRREE